MKRRALRAFLLALGFGEATVLLATGVHALLVVPTWGPAMLGTLFMVPLAVVGAWAALRLADARGAGGAWPFALLVASFLAPAALVSLLAGPVPEDGGAGAVVLRLVAALTPLLVGAFAGARLTRSAQGGVALGLLGLLFGTAFSQQVALTGLLSWAGAFLVVLMALLGVSAASYYRVVAGLQKDAPSAQ